MVASASRRVTAKTGLVAAALLLVVVSGILLCTEVPRWTLAGTRMIGHDSLSPLGQFPIALPSNGPVLVIGDSNSAGSRVGGAANAYPAAMASALGIAGRLRVVAVGGARAADMQRRGAAAEPAALAIIMLGSNDAAPRGWLDSDKPVPVPQYRKTMTDMARQLATDGASVLILAPPPTGSVAMERRLAPYRIAARAAAGDAKVAFLDPVAAFDGAEATLQFDALHLNVEAQRKLGLWLASTAIRR